MPTEEPVRRLAAGFPANPLSIELKFSHRRLWWQTDDEDHLPERWNVSCDVGPLARCARQFQHVGDIEFVIADLRRERNLLDAIAVGEWGLEFIAETVIDPKHGLLHPELNDWISPGPTEMVILQGIRLTPAWQGHGLGSALTAGALRAMAQRARLAVCRVSPVDFLPSVPDRITAELASVRMAALIERIGFTRWRDVHVVDLSDPRLLDARMDLFEHWDPHAGPSPP